MMKTHKLFGIVLLLFFANSHAQEKELPADPEERARQITEWMKTNLQLSDAQVPKVQAVNYKCAQKNVEL